MSLNDTTARVRCLGRQVTSLKDDLRRETRRSMDALKRVKEKEISLTALEDKANDLCIVNNRLKHDLEKSEKRERKAESQKEVVRSRFEMASSENRKALSLIELTVCTDLTQMASELFRIENAIGETSRASKNSFLQRIENEVGQVAQRLLKLKANLQTTENESSSVHESVRREDEDPFLGNLEISCENGSEMEKILKVYRTTTAKLRQQVEYVLSCNSIAEAEEACQKSLLKNQSFEEEMETLRESLAESERQNHEVLETKRASDDALMKTVQTLRESCESKRSKIEELERTIVQLQGERDAIRNRFLEQEQKQMALKTFIDNQRKTMALALSPKKDRFSSPPHRTFCPFPFELSTQRETTKNQTFVDSLNEIQPFEEPFDPSDQCLDKEVAHLQSEIQRLSKNNTRLTQPQFDFPLLDSDEF